MLAATLALAAALQVQPADQARPRMRLCTAQNGGLRQSWGVVRPEGLYWWTDWDEAIPFDASAEVTARQRDWFHDRRDLTVNGLTYAWQGEVKLDDWPFNRYNRVGRPVDGVPMLVPMGSEEREIWLLLDPVDCLFAVWSRDPEAAD